jgi:predicted nuclease of predicted toxin-antitoxin system
MRLKLDENMPRPLAESLRRVGHDVHTASDEDLLGKSDRVVWSVVVHERRLLLTLDRDFGQLATQSNDHAGAIVLRPRDANKTAIEALALRALALATDIDMTNRIVIFEDERIRIRPPLALVPPQDQS